MAGQPLIHSPQFWRLWNVLRRAVGLCWIVAGAGFLGWALALLIRPSSAQLLDPGLTRGEAVLAFLAAGCVGLTGGVLACRLRPYRPDRGDANWFTNPVMARLQRHDDRGARNWWTGDSVNHH